MNYDDFLNLARSRRSIRKFSRKPVTRAEIERVLEAARWAPSNHNRQPWHFIVLDEQPAIEHLAQTVKQSLKQRTRSLPEIASHHAEELVEYASLFGEAPVLVVVLHKRPVSLVSTLLSNLSQPALVSGEPLSAAMAAAESRAGRSFAGSGDLHSHRASDCSGGSCRRTETAGRLRPDLLHRPGLSGRIACSTTKKKSVAVRRV